ncbi:MAG TPA: type II toxin-antitoxin system HicA family toxin, partial [Desulfatiglandales bacterium]|nr:type II toxin-antitoxin system HicA family toxin [Desulfatiglandales bacterium]
VHWKVLEKVFLAAGFRFARQEGSHRAYVKPDIARPLIIPTYTEVSVAIPFALHSFPPQVPRGGTLLKPAPWNQLLRLSRLSPALPVTQLLQTCNYQSAAIPPGCNDPQILP